LPALYIRVGNERYFGSYSREPPYNFDLVSAREEINAIHSVRRSRPLHFVSFRPAIVPSILIAFGNRGAGLKPSLQWLLQMYKLQ